MCHWGIVKAIKISLSKHSINLFCIEWNMKVVLKKFFVTRTELQSSEISTMQVFGKYKYKGIYSQPDWNSWNLFQNFITLLHWAPQKLLQEPLSAKFIVKHFVFDDNYVEFMKFSEKITENHNFRLRFPRKRWVPSLMEGESYLDVRRIL